MKKSDKIKAVLIGATAGVILGFTVNAVETALDMPDAYWSNTTNECVGVVNYTKNDFMNDNVTDLENKASNNINYHIVR